jgi:hypothetical protein
MDVFFLKIEQAIQHTKLLVSNIWTQDDIIGKILQNTVDQLQIQAGISWAMLTSSNPGTKWYGWLYVDPCYLSHAWEFLHSIGNHL